MNTGCFLPEGWLLGTAENAVRIRTMGAVKETIAAGDIVEGRATVCDSGHNLYVEFGPWRGFIPREEGAIGISDGTVKDIAILSRVGKPVCFKILGLTTDPDGRLLFSLSRKAAQLACREHYINQLKLGDVIPAEVTHLEPFGCFVDIGCGISSLIPIDSISVSRISHPSDRFQVGQNIRAVIKALEGGRVFLTHKELLGTWEENARLFHRDETVTGIVRSVEHYGIFVELTPNLAGLAEPKEGVQVGQTASVYIKSLIPEKMKIKLTVVDSFFSELPDQSMQYYEDSGHIDRWRYSPACCPRLVETVFGQE